ncbi:MAG: bacterial transcriptional activator domain-containing protein [Bacteroidota bacterium]
MKNIDDIHAKKESASLLVQTLGVFEVERDGEILQSKDWGRDKSIQLFQFLVTARHQRALHKEQIIDRIWDEYDVKAGEQNFKVAQHGMNKALEPNRKSRAEPKYIIRQGVTYQLDLTDIWIDSEALEAFIKVGNHALHDDPYLAIEAYRAALDLHHGTYLPNRLYEDWSSSERERLQILALGAYINLSELLLEDNPMESIRLCQQALLIENTWEDAYRIQMEAYLKNGNRPMAIKTFRQCESVLEKEFGVKPLPETAAVFKGIMAI